jgi:hypothetical protein
MTCEPGDLPSSRGHVRKRRAGCTGVDEAFVPARVACEAKFNSQ